MYVIANKIRYQIVKLFLVACIITLETAVSADEVPEMCEGPYETMFYNAGVATGQNLVDMAWNMIDDCDKIEYFESVIVSLLERLAPPENASLTVLCRYAGYAKGIMSRIDDIYTGCEVICYNEGMIIGELAAIAYCEISLQLGGLDTADQFIRMPVQMCGFNFEFGCDIKFMSLTFEYTNIYGSCEQYTWYGDYFEVWDQVRNNQCAYGIEDPSPVEPPEEKDG